MPSPDAAMTTLLVWLLLGAALIGMLARWASVPYAVALVLGGVLVEESHFVALPRLEPDLVLQVFLPPLLFDAAFRLDAEGLRRDWRTIVWLAVPGTLGSAAVVGAALAVVVGLPPVVALLFGGMVAATDPVAVVAVFNRLRVPARLALVAEGESLVNDGVAITLYAVVLALLATGQVNPVDAASGFAWQVVVGVGLGLGLGVLCSRLTGLIDDHLVEMTLSTALAYGSYLAASALGASGALACVAAGLVHGSYGRQVGMSANTRARLDDLWEYLGFVANGFLFLLVGFSANLGALAGRAGPVAVAVCAVVAARVLVVEVGGWIVPAGRRAFSARERGVLVWGGLRGALTIALALALPSETPERELLIELAFGVVLFTLVVQGLTLAPLIRLLRVNA